MFQIRKVNVNICSTIVIWTDLVWTYIDWTNVVSTVVIAYFVGVDFEVFKRSFKSLQSVHMVQIASPN